MRSMPRSPPSLALADELAAALASFQIGIAGAFAAWPVLAGRALFYVLIMLMLGAFWIRRVLPALLIVQKLMFLLGGLFAPISLSPAWLRRLAEATPFAAHLAFAGQAVLAPSAAGFWRALAWQGAWLVGLAGLAALIWRAGVAKVMKGGV